MTVLIKQARIIDPSSPYNQTTQDILVESGIIQNIGNLNDSIEGETFSGNDLHVSPGWVDIFANFSDPGYEFRETLESGSNAAAAGGFTDVFVIPI
jgi:dihydroorotase